MPRIFWTVKRKYELSRLSKTKTPKELSEYYNKPESEIIRLLAIMQPPKSMIISVEHKNGIKITKFRPGYCEGAEPQQMGKYRDIY